MDYEVEAKIARLLAKPTRELSKEENFALFDAMEQLKVELKELEKRFPQAIGDYFVVDLIRYPCDMLKITVYDTLKGRALAVETGSDEKIEALIKALETFRKIKQMRELRDKISDHANRFFYDEWLKQKRG